MSHFIAEGQFIPPRRYLVTAHNRQDAEQLFEEYLFMRLAVLYLRHKRVPLEYQRSSYTFCELPEERGVTGLPVWT